MSKVKLHNTYIYHSEYPDNYISIKYPIFGYSNHFSYQVLGDKDFFQEYQEQNHYITAFYLINIQTIGFENQEIVIDAIQFIIDNYDVQIPHSEWQSDCKVTINQKIGYVDSKFIIEHSQEIDRVYNKNYINYQYKNYNRLDIKIHNIIIQMLGIYPITLRRILYYYDFGNSDTALTVQSIANNICSFAKYNDLLLYQQFAILSIYYCSQYVALPIDDTMPRDEYLSKAIQYSQLACLLFGYVNGTKQPLDKMLRGAHKTNSSDGKVYEYIQYRVYQYLKKESYDPCKVIELLDNQAKELKNRITTHIMKSEGYFEVCIFRTAHLGGKLKCFKEYQDKCFKEDQPHNKKYLSSGKAFETLSKIVECYLNYIARYISIDLTQQDSKNLQEIVTELATKNIIIQEY